MLLPRNSKHQESYEFVYASGLGGGGTEKLGSVSAVTQASGFKFRQCDSEVHTLNLCAQGLSEFSISQLLISFFFLQSHLSPAMRERCEASWGLDSDSNLWSSSTLAPRFTLLRFLNHRPPKSIFAFKSDLVLVYIVLEPLKS